MRTVNILFVSYLLLFVNATVIAQSRNRLIVGFYNCENFFDTIDDPAKDDEDFTPGGKYRYTYSIYQQKLKNISSVVAAMRPAVLGLAEIENTTVLKELTSQPSLTHIGYRYILHTGPDPRGINVALIYDPASFRVLKSEPIKVDISSTSGKSVTRDVLHVHGILIKDTVDIFVNHWPSRRGGTDESNDKRSIAAQANRDAAARLLKKNKNAHIIIMGDLNDNPADPSITKILGAVADKRSSGTYLYNPFASVHASGLGTEVYRKQWNLFDQIIISSSLLTDKTLTYNGSEIFKPSFIIDTYKGHEGEPHRSFKGPRWINGYSDHFPVVTYFTTSSR
jgi:predicted extracellular nuclease